MANKLRTFISYSLEDSEFAHQLADDLSKFDIQVWIASEDIRPGEDWVEVINRGLEECSHMIVVLSHLSIQSKWVQKETSVAIALELQGRLQLIPIKIQDCDPPSLWTSYQTISFIDNYESGLDKLCQVIKSSKVKIQDSYHKSEDYRKSNLLPTQYRLNLHKLIAIKTHCSIDNVQLYIIHTDYGNLRPNMNNKNSLKRNDEIKLDDIELSEFNIFKHSIEVELGVNECKSAMFQVEKITITKRDYMQGVKTIEFKVFDSLYELEYSVTGYDKPDLKNTDKMTYTNRIKGNSNILVKNEEKGDSKYRKTPIELTLNEARLMIIEKDFFDSYKNENGKGVLHNYVLKRIDGDEIVHDDINGLMWQQSGSPEIIEAREDVKAYVQELNSNKFAGFNNWRIPTLEEAMTLIEAKKYGKRFIDPIFDSTQTWIWTSDEKVDRFEIRIFTIDFASGYCNYPHVDHVKSYVRAVRSLTKS